MPEGLIANLKWLYGACFCGEKKTRRGTGVVVISTTVGSTAGLAGGCVAASEGCLAAATVPKLPVLTALAGGLFGFAMPAAGAVVVAAAKGIQRCYNDNSGVEKQEEYMRYPTPRTPPIGRPERVQPGGTAGGYQGEGPARGVAAGQYPDTL